MEYAILILGWIIFGVLHSALAADKWKCFLKTRMGNNYRYYRLIYSIVSVLILTAVLAWQLSISPSYFLIAPAVKYSFSIPFGIPGIVLMIASINKYFYKFSGVEALHHVPGPPVLETHGLHKHIRHPLYAGTLLVIWSALLWAPTIASLISCSMITVYIRIGIIFEERGLIRTFGSQYKEYKRNTPMLFPLRSRIF